MAGLELAQAQVQYQDMKATTTIKNAKKTLKTVKEMFAEERVKFYAGPDRKRLQALLRDHGFHSTEGRLVLLSVLKSSERPLEVLELTKRCDGHLDEVNVYRSLDAFRKAGIVRRIDLQLGHAERYELADDHHHHIVCTECGIVKDFDACDAEKIAHTALKQVRGFASVDRHTFELFGLCTPCARICRRRMSKARP